MIDIDFRFVMGQIPAPEFGENITKRGPVLQWRKKILTKENWGLDENGKPCPVLFWTEWQDVRTEEE